MLADGHRDGAYALRTIDHEQGFDVSTKLPDSIQIADLTRERVDPWKADHAGSFSYCSSDLVDGRHRTRRLHLPDRNAEPALQAQPREDVRREVGGGDNHLVSLLEIEPIGYEVQPIGGAVGQDDLRAIRSYELGDGRPQTIGKVREGLMCLEMVRLGLPHDHLMDGVSSQKGKGTLMSCIQPYPVGGQPELRANIQHIANSITTSPMAERKAGATFRGFVPLVGRRARQMTTTISADLSPRWSAVILPIGWLILTNGPPGQLIVFLVGGILIGVRLTPRRPAGSPAFLS